MSNLETERQNEFIKKIRLINNNEFKKTGKQKYYFNLVMGCQMNAHDSEKLAGMLTDMGYTETLEETKADFIIYNTCCVRENAELKVYGKLGALKNYKLKNPNVLIAVCGCMMQQQAVIDNIKKTYRHVDIIFGTHNLYKLPELMDARIDSGSMIVDVWEEAKEIVEDLPSIRKFKYKASINIMYGCNNFCSYCIVPYVRGRERSRQPEDIIAEIKRLVADGVVNLTLLGQNVNSYGKTLENPISFAKLLRMIDEVDGLEQVTFMTSHPKDLSDELIEAIKDCKKVMNYLHLPVQSGSNDILKKMNRGYTKEDYLELIDKLKAVRPNIHISSDIIVGFPGETEADFQETIDICQKVRFSTVFTFIYSKRTGTPAANMENQISEDVIKDRFDRLLNIVNPIVGELNKSQVGSTVRVFAEEINKQDPTLLTGRSDNNSIVHFKAGEDRLGKFSNVKIIGNKTFYLVGELAD